MSEHCRSGFDSDCKSGDEDFLLLLESAIDIMTIILYIGVVFSFYLSLDQYHFDFLMILKEPLTFLSLSNMVLQYGDHRHRFCFIIGSSSENGSNILKISWS